MRQVPEQVRQDARRAYERRSGGLVVARLVGDETRGEVRALRFTAASEGVEVEVDVEVQPGAVSGTVLLSVRLHPPLVRRLFLRGHATSLTALTDDAGEVADLPGPTGPLSVVVVGPPSVQTEWLVV